MPAVVLPTAATLIEISALSARLVLAVPVPLVAPAAMVTVPIVVEPLTAEQVSAEL